MATFATVVSPFAQNSVKVQKKFRVVQITGDTDIPAAATGYVLSNATLGLTFCEGGIGSVTTDGVYYVSVTPLGASGARMRYWNADDGVEAAAGENGVDGTICSVVVYGY